MKKLAILFILPVVLQAQSGDITCHSDFSEDGLAINKQCQVSFKLSSDNGCPVVTADIPRYSSVGMKFHSEINNKVDKVLEETAKTSNPSELDNCRFDGDLLVCNCGTDLCNKDWYILWNILVNTKFELLDQCRQAFIETAWKEVEKWPKIEDKNTEIIKNPVKCLDSNTDVTVMGDYCVATFTVMPGTYYILEYPAMSAANSTG